jgi:hypothetical protein
MLWDGRESMAKESAKKNGRKKSLEQLAQFGPSEIVETVRCTLLDYKTDGTPMLIYKRALDSTIHGAWIHPDTDLKYLKKIVRKKNRELWGPNAWITICKGYPISQTVKQYQYFVRHVAKYFEEIENSISAEEELRRDEESLPF